MNSRNNSRYFTNPYPDYSKERISQLLVKQSEHEYCLHPDLLNRLDEFNTQYLQLVLSKYKNYQNRDYSVYTGLSGILCLLLRLLKDSELDLITHKEIKMNYVLPCLENSQRDGEISFMCGKMGAMALTAVYYHRIKELDKRDQLVQTILNCPDWISKPDEILYGKCGFLYTLLYLRSELQLNVFDHLIPIVCRAILQSGEEYARATKSASPLMFQWYDTEYMGAAHGLTGILYMLLEAKQFLTDGELMIVKESVDYVLRSQFPISGNFPAANKEKDDELIHWCHGAPGVIHLLVKAFQVFGTSVYLLSAEKCADLIWEKGLLKKGYGLCHGVSGNAYGFLILYRTTYNPLYFYRALKFAEYCLDYGSHGCRTPDKPFSLMEGLAGTLYFLHEIKSPMTAKFPAFNL